MKNFRSIVFKKAYKLAKLGRSNPLKSAWRWYYKKIAKRVNIEFHIDGIVYDTVYKGVHIEYCLTKENSYYSLDLYISDIDYQLIELKCFRRADLMSSFIYVFNRRLKKVDESPLYFDMTFFPNRV